MSATGRPRAGGFTLIEALVVVAITGLIGALAFPRLDAAIAAQAFRTATATLARTLEDARARAIRSAEAVPVAIVDGGHAVRVANGAPITLPADYVVSTPDQPVVRFFADGTASGGRMLLLGKGHRAALTVAAATGHVSVSAIS